MTRQCALATLSVLAALVAIHVYKEDAVVVPNSVVSPNRVIDTRFDISSCLAGKKYMVKLNHNLSTIGHSDYFEDTSIQQDDELLQHKRQAYLIPNHIATKSRLDADRQYKLISHVVLLDVQEKVRNNSCYAVTIQDVLDWESEHGLVPNGSLIIAKTGWYTKVGNSTEYFGTLPSGERLTPGFGDAVALFLLTQRDIHALGVDVPSVDCGCSTTQGAFGEVHNAGKYIIENLNLAPNIPASGACSSVTLTKILVDTMAYLAEVVVFF